MRNDLQFAMSLAKVGRLTKSINRKALAFEGDDGLLLDLAEAELFCTKYPPELKCLGGDFSLYARATPDALEFLANQGWRYVHLGLAELDKANARVLARWSTSCHFTSLEYLDTEIAAILSEGKGVLSFQRSMVVSPELARELVKFDGQLHLKMDSLSLDVANELAMQPHELLLDLKVLPSEQILHMLCNHAGYYLLVGGWEHKSESELSGFVSANPDKIVQFHQPENEHGERWLDAVLIEEDYRSWMDKRNRHLRQN